MNDDIKWFSKFQENDGREEAISFGVQRVICDLWERNFKVVVGTDKQLKVIAEWVHTICTHSFAELLVGYSRTRNNCISRVTLNAKATGMYGYIHKPKQKTSNRDERDIMVRHTTIAMKDVILNLKAQTLI